MSRFLWFTVCTPKASILRREYRPKFSLPVFIVFLILGPVYITCVINTNLCIMNRSENIGYV